MVEATSLQEVIASARCYRWKDLGDPPTRTSAPGLLIATAIHPRFRE